MKTVLRGLCLVLLSLVAFAAYGAAEPARAVVVIVLDGLRPDYVTPEVMPNLHALAQEGVRCTNHRSTYPTVTRINATTIATGCYPAHHGILGNAMYLPEVDGERVLSMADAGHLLRIEEATGGKLLTVPSLGEVLQSQGKTIFVASAGSAGSAMLLNPRFAGGGVANVELVRPELMKAHLDAAAGPVPEEGSPNKGRNRWAVDAYLKYALPELKPDLTFIWLSDPDHTAHEFGIGAPETVESLRAVDGEVRRIVDGVRAVGLDGSTDFFVISDHGFTTRTGKDSLSVILVNLGLKQSRESLDVAVAGDAIHVKDDDPDVIRRIATELQKHPSIGAIFSAPLAPGDYRGTVPGTLSYGVIHWDHARAADLLVSWKGDGERNIHGFPGTTTGGGVAGHGSASAYDLHAVLMAWGPDLKSGVDSALHTGQIDIAPTVCRLLGFDPPAHMDGRVLEEILRDGPDPASLRADRATYEAVSPVNGETRFAVRAVLSRVGRSDYLDSASGEGIEKADSE
jgi:predicted AlkP superfamily pyrophosphatase or phosphodiesterase